MAAVVRPSVFAIGQLTHAARRSFGEVPAGLVASRTRRRRGSPRRTTERALGLTWSISSLRDGGRPGVADGTATMLAVHRVGPSEALDRR